MSEQSSPQTVTREEFALLLEDVVRVGIQVRDQLHILNTHLASNSATLPVHDNEQEVENSAVNLPQ